MTPQAFTDSASENFRELTARMNFSNDDFIRITEARHRACQKLWPILSNAAISPLEAMPDGTPSGTRPFTPKPKSSTAAPTGAPVEWVEEPSYFFNLSQWQQPLLDFYEANPDFVGPASRFNEVKSFVKGGLRDPSVSCASFSWGVPVPDDDAHVMYVWLDALTNYLTATGWPVDGDFGDKAMNERFGLPTMVGKDILRFHAVYGRHSRWWPGLRFRSVFSLMAGGPTKARRLKSLGNVIDPNLLAEEFGLDQTRYFLMRGSFGNDDFSRRAMIHRMNGDLANDLGNLSQRVLSMIFKNCGGVMPALPETPAAEDRAVLDSADTMLARVRGHMESQ